MVTGHSHLFTHLRVRHRSIRSPRLPSYTGGLERLAIGFRLAEQQSFHYGYGCMLEPWMPHVEGIVVADQPNVDTTGGSGS